MESEICPICGHQLWDVGGAAISLVCPHCHPELFDWRGPVIEQAGQTAQKAGQAVAGGPHRTFMKSVLTPAQALLERLERKGAEPQVVAPVEPCAPLAPQPKPQATPVIATPVRPASPLFLTDPLVRCERCHYVKARFDLPCPGGHYIPAGLRRPICLSCERHVIGDFPEDYWRSLARVALRRHSAYSEVYPCPTCRSTLMLGDTICRSCKTPFSTEQSMKYSFVQAAKDNGLPTDKISNLVFATQNWNSEIGRRLLNNQPIRQPDSPNVVDAESGEATCPTCGLRLIEYSPRCPCGQEYSLGDALLIRYAAYEMKCGSDAREAARKTLDYMMTGRALRLWLRITKPGTAENPSCECLVCKSRMTWDERRCDCAEAPYWLDDTNMALHVHAVVLAMKGDSKLMIDAYFAQMKADPAQLVRNTRVFADYFRHIYGVPGASAFARRWLLPTLVQPD